MPRFIGTRCGVKRHDHLAAGGPGKFLVELGHVAVVADAVSVKAFGHFREQHILARRPPRPGHARFGVDDDLVGIDRVRLQQRDQRQLGAARVAAGIGDEPRRLDLSPIDLGETVDRVFLQFGRGVGMAVPARIGGRIGQAEIGRKIDDLDARRARQQMLDHRLRRGVRQRAESKIKPERLPIDGIERRQRRQGEGQELRKHVRHRLAGPAIGGQQHDFRARMADEQPQQFRAGIAGGAEHPDLGFFFLFFFRRHWSTLDTSFGA